MGYWGHRIWHPSVHARFKDRLIFYRAQARPFSPHTIKAGIESLVAEKNLHNLNAFVIFGHYDLLFRAWLHTNVVHGLEYTLAGELGIEVPEAFVVEHEYGAESDLKVSASDKLWNQILYHQTVRALQDGQQNGLLDELVRAQLVTLHRSHNSETIRFYVAIRVEAKPGLGRELLELMSQRQVLHRPIVYEGSGFCTYLIKAEVHTNAYFSIEALTESVLERLKHFGASTETYLVSSPIPIHRGEDLITDSTLIEFRGRNPLIQIVIPEVYENLSKAGDEIIHVLQTHEGGVRDLAVSNRQLLGAFLQGHLTSQAHYSKVALFLYFSEVEKYLRETFPRFLAARGLNYRDVLTAARAKKGQGEHGGLDHNSNREHSEKEDGKNIAIGDLLSIYFHAAQLLNETERTRCGSLPELAKLRNEIMHGSYGADAWERYVSVLVRDLPAVSRVLDWIEVTMQIEPPFKDEFSVKSRK